MDQSTMKGLYIRLKTLEFLKALRSVEVNALTPRERNRAIRAHVKSRTKDFIRSVDYMPYKRFLKDKGLIS